MSEERYDLLERTYEFDGEELTGFEVLSGAYGLAVREQQFQEFYSSFSRVQRLLSTGSFRSGTSRVEDAVDDFIENANTYLGMDISPEEFAGDASYLAAARGSSVPEYSQEVLEAISGSEGPVSEEEMREIVSGIRDEHHP